MEQEQSDNAILIQKALNRMLNTDDGKIVLAHLMNEFVLKVRMYHQLQALIWLMQLVKLT